MNPPLYYLTNIIINKYQLWKLLPHNEIISVCFLLICILSIVHISSEYAGILPKIKLGLCPPSVHEFCGDPVDPEVFYQCDGGYLKKFNCPPGLVYNTDTDECDYPNWFRFYNESTKIFLLKK